MGQGEARALFHRVAEGVPQVQELALPIVHFVPRHIVPLDGNAPGDHLLHPGFPSAGAQGREQRRVAQHAVFQHFRQAIPLEFSGQIPDHVGVAEHDFGLVKGPGHVFARPQIHRRLAAHGGIHGGQQGGGYLDEAGAPAVYRRGKARQIPRHAAAQGHHQIGTGQLNLAQPFQRVAEGVHGFVLLPVGKGPNLRRKPGGGQAVHHRFAVQNPHGVVGDDRRFAGLHHLGDFLPGSRHQPRADQHVVAA